MPFLRPLELGFLRRCDTIIATSPTLLEKSNALKPVKEKCTSIPLSLPPYNYDRLGRGGLLPTKKPTTLFVGRLVGYKGLVYLIHAMKKVDAHLLIAGDGPLRVPLERMANIAGLSDRISFLGQVSDEEKLELYRQADIFVLPSISANEAFGYVLLEAMTEGLPVISCDLPTGVSYVNQHEHTGLVVPPKNSGALAEAMQRLLSDDELRKTYSMNARRRVLTEFNFEETINGVERVYRQSLPG